MTPPKSISTTIKFGKYSGRTIENIWTGKTEASKELIIKEYLQDFFQTFNGLSKEPKKVTAPDSDLQVCEKEISFLQSKNVFLNIYASRRHLTICENNNSYLSPLRKVVRSLLTGSFNNLTKTGFQSAPNLIFSKQSFDFITLFADPAYISWAIATINDFFIHPEDLEFLQEKSSSKIVGFELNDIYEDIIEYKAIFEVFNYTLPEEIKNKNLIKYQFWASHEDNDDVFNNRNSHNYEKDTFDALTDGQCDDYDTWKENDGDMDNLRDRLGF